MGGSALAKGASNLRRRKKFVQHNEERKQPPCSGTYRQHIWMFAFVRKIFKAWGASASRACAGRRPAPPFLENFSYKRETANMLSIRPWAKGLLPFLIIFSKLFSTSQIGSSLCACASSTSSFSNVDDELIAKTSTLRIRNSFQNVFLSALLYEIET